MDNTTIASQEVPDNQPKSEIAPMGAIYIRAAQETTSITGQEVECRRIASEHGINIVDVYRDVEPYQVNNHTYAPSGARVDRPGLRAMMADAASGKFARIVTSSEDRLYRGYEAKIFILDYVRNYHIDILLTKGVLDITPPTLLLD